MITRAQQLIRETSRSLIDIALDVGYTSPSHFAGCFAMNESRRQRVPI